MPNFRKPFTFAPLILMKPGPLGKNCLSSPPHHPEKTSLKTASSSFSNPEG